MDKKKHTVTGNEIFKNARKRIVTSDTVENDVKEWLETKDESLRQDILIYVKEYIGKYMNGKNLAGALYGRDAYEDAAQEALENICRKMERYDPSYGTTFISFITYDIIAAARKTYRRLGIIRIPDKMQQDARKINLAATELMKESEEVTTEKLAAMTGLTEGRIESIREYRRLDNVASWDELQTKEETKSKKADSIEDMLTRESRFGRMKEIILELVERGAMEPHQADLFIWFFLESFEDTKTIKDVCDAYGIEEKTANRRIKEATQILINSDLGPEFYELLGGEGFYKKKAEEEAADPCQVGERKGRKLDLVAALPDDAAYVGRFGVYVTPEGAVYAPGRSGGYNILPVSYSNGYATVGTLLARGEEKKQQGYLHLLLTMAFCGNPGVGTCVSFRDGDRNNLSIRNLMWTKKTKK